MSMKRPLISAVLVCCTGLLIAVVAVPKFQPDRSVGALSSEFSTTESSESHLNEPIKPLVADLALDKNKVALGKILFHDQRLSSDNSVSCATCHTLNTGGADNLFRSIGVDGQLGSANAPTVFNSGFNSTQFWDGRADTLEDQIDGPVHNPVEMGSSWPQIVGKLQADAAYPALFDRSYADGITSSSIKDAIATFEHSLVTLNSPFDRYLRGEVDAISENAKAGYATFKEFGCIACHQGRNVGGNVFQRLGVMGDYFGDRGTEITQSDFGRFNVTGLKEDKFVFRVPSLRLAALTPPYFHDGSVATLQEAVRTMITYQLGRIATDEEERNIVEFIRSLAGEYDGRQL